MDTPCPRKLHRKAFYWRYGSADSVEKDVPVDCFRCPLCRRCFSVIPEGMMPYRPLPSAAAAAYADQQSGLIDIAETVAAQSARQRRSWQSFWGAFVIHAIVLAGILGIDLNSKPPVIWKALRHRKNGNSTPASAILIELHAWRTSFTFSYLSLKPWWDGGLARGP